MIRAEDFIYIASRRPHPGKIQMGWLLGVVGPIGPSYMGHPPLGFYLISFHALVLFVIRHNYLSVLEMSLLEPD